MSKKTLYAFFIVLFSLSLLSFRPGMWLVDKPANTGNEHYVRGWKDGCISGTNSYSLLYAPLMNKPFIKEADEGATTEGTTKTAKTAYNSAWNEGFTLCRYYQSSVYELMQFAIIVMTLLFIGYQLKKKRD